MTTTTTIDYNKRLKIHAARNITYILDKLEVSFVQRGKLIQAKCPCHQHTGDGNNPTAFSWRTDYENWKCWTHHCDEVYGTDVFGLVRSVMEINFAESKAWIEKVLRAKDVDISENVSTIRHHNTGEVHIHSPLDEMRLSFLRPEYPPQYLLKRGFDKDILRKYQVGEWHKLGTFMHNRIVIPVRDQDGLLVGFTGRAIGEDYEDSKWIHGRFFDRFSGDFKTGSILFNLYNAKNHLVNRKIILCEGPLDGFAFEMASIKNWTSTLGTTFQPQHRSLLIQLGVNEIITAYDPDKAGEEAHERVLKIVGNLIKVAKMEGLEDDPGSYTKNLNKLKELYDATD